MAASSNYKPEAGSFQTYFGSTPTDSTNPFAFVSGQYANSLQGGGANDESAMDVASQLAEVRH